MAASLNTPHFYEESEEGKIAPDPIIPTRVKTNLDNLIPYMGNPRITENPNFDSIKESIRNIGLSHKPNITRKQPDQPYMIADGGNTRLKILRELWEETGDLRFYELDCMFYPWENDLKILFGHMIENEERGTMLFIERALAAYRIKTELEALENAQFSVRELAKKITENGWTVAAPTLSQLLYAHDDLFPIIPNTFWNGLGRDGVKRIRKTLDNARTFWDSVATKDDGDFDDIWRACFAALDGDGFDLGDAQNQLEADIALRLDANIMSVRGEIQAIAQGVSPGGIRPSNIKVSAPDLQNQNPGNSSNLASKIKQKLPPTQPNNTDENVHSHNVDSNENVTDSGNDTSALKPATVLSSAASYSQLTELSTSELMNHAYGLALEYASYFEFDQFVELASNANFTGLSGFHSGYVLRPIPHAIDESSLYPYVYLHQLSRWCAVDSTNPAFNAVSDRIPLSFISSADFERMNNAMVFRRACIHLAYINGSADGELFPLMNELELTLGLIFLRCKSYVQGE